MLAEAPYIDIEYDNNFLEVSNFHYEWKLEEKETPKDNVADVYIFNAWMNKNYQETMEAVQIQLALSDTTNAYNKVSEYTERYPNIFAGVSKDAVLTSYMKAYNDIKEIVPDVIHTDISLEDECLFIYFQKGNAKVFFNMFYDDDIEALINISAEQHKYTIEDTIDNGISRMSEILCEKAENMC